jgi:Fur family iron response transcriptional regulator
MAEPVADRLRAHGIQPSAQRLAVAEYVLRTQDHPSADEVLARVRGRVPMISRATVYNTLNLFVEKGLLRQFVLAEGRLVFDPHLAPHHHFVDDASGTIHDVPWEALEVRRVEKLQGLDVSEYQVVLRGRRSPPRKAS